MSLLRSSLITGGLTLVSRFLGLARDLALTAVMGAGGAADAFNTALNFPNLWRRLFAEGAFATAFIPTYTRTMVGEGPEAADKVAREAMAALAAFTILLSTMAQLFMPAIMAVISPGFLSDPAKFKLAVVLTQITMPYLPCMAIAALLSGVLNARGRFVASAGSQSLLNLVMLAFVLPQKTAEDAAYYASIGVIVAGIFQVGLLFWAARKAGARIAIVWPKMTPAVRRILLLAAPGALAASATQVNILVSSWFASYVDGARSWLAYADRLYQLPLGIVGVGIGVALLPRLSASLRANDVETSQKQMDEAINFAMVLTLPAAAALLAMPFFIVEGMFVRGLFTLKDAAHTSLALFHYAWGVPAFVLIKLFTPPFFAREDTRTPMRYALISVAVNIVLGALFFQLLGFEGIAAATSTAAWVNVLLLLRTLLRRGYYAPSNFALQRLFRVLTASLILACVLGVANLEKQVLAHWLWGSITLAALVTLLAGMLLYCGVIYLIDGVEVADIKAAFQRPTPKAANKAKDPDSMAPPSQ